MRLVGPDGEEERLRLVPLRGQPVDRLVHHQRGRIALERADRLAVADEVVRVLVARGGVVLGGQPVLVAVVARLRLGGVVELAVEVPLADVAGGVTRLLEQLRQGDLAGRRWTSLPSAIQV